MRSRGLLDRATPATARWMSAIPFVSAVVVTVLGTGIRLGGLRGALAV